MRQFTLISFLILIHTGLKGQTGAERLSGKISFISSQNVYVKFGSTKGISAGDTLFISSEEKLIPVLIVNNLSSVSCVCTSISDIVLPVDHLIIAETKAETPKPDKNITGEMIKKTTLPEVQTDSAGSSTEPEKQKQKIMGSISANSYSDFSNTVAPDLQRFRFTFSLVARNIADSKISFESYLSFRHNTGRPTEAKGDLFSSLKIYNLSLRYDLNKSTNLIFGRRINPKISNMGAIDGLQFEKSIKGLTLGALAGMRPDYSNYGINPDLFQYGGYLSVNTEQKGFNSESSVAIIQQMNKSVTDRRFLYFQHYNSPVKNIYFLSSFEIDLYKLENDLPRSIFELTSAYISIRYNIAKRVTITGSYDARRNVIYYETYKTYTDRILEDEIRQGYRLNGNWRIAENMTFGLQTGYRFLKSDPHPSKNIYSYFTYRRIPVLNISATLSGTLLESVHMNGKIAGINLSRDFSGGKIQTGIGYHFVEYQLPENKLDIKQHAGEANFYWQLMESVTLAVNYEMIIEPEGKYNRVYLQIRKRF